MQEQGTASAQDLGPQIRKIGEGIYVYVGKNFNSNAGIVVTDEGVVLIDSGHNPTDSRAIADAVKKLTPKPVRFLIDSEPHADHTTGHYRVLAACHDHRRGRRRRLPCATPNAKGRTELRRWPPPHRK